MWTLIPGDWRPKSTAWLIQRMEPIAANAQRCLSRMPEEAEACHCEQSEASAVRHDRDEKQIPRADTVLGMTTEGEAQGSATGIQETQRVMAGEKADPSASSPGGPQEEGRDDKWGRGTGEESGDILCLHDGYHRQLNADRTNTLAALEHWLPRWRDLGLDFVTMDEAVR